MNTYKDYIRKKINPALLFVYKLYGVEVKDNLLSYPLEQKRVFIKDTYMSRPDITCFIETGTCKGDTIEYVKNDFKKIYSIELSKTFTEEAIFRFQNDSHVKIIPGDSAIELPKLLQNISEPCFFWLDGHYSYGDTAKGDKESPILEEIKPILTSPHNHIILIDDARLFIGRHSYPTIFSLVRFIKKHNPSYTVSIIKDMILVTK